VRSRVQNYFTSVGGGKFHGNGVFERRSNRIFVSEVEV
jgi:hypothetical protein